MSERVVISDMKDIPRERWGYALGLIMVQQLSLEGVHAIVAAGEDEFVRQATLVDSMGLQSEDYRRAFSRLVRAAAMRPLIPSNGKIH